MQLFNLPNFLTLINLFSGCMAVVFILHSDGYELQFVGIFTLISLVADYFDGLAARLTNQKSEIGKQLDSLADMVSFGVVPGMLVYTLLSFYYEMSFATKHFLSQKMFCSIGFIITLFSALRLAKFNIDTRQTDSFIGLATPANTIFWMGLFYGIFTNQYGIGTALMNPIFLIVLVAVFAYLLIAEIPMFSFKFKNFNWQENKLQFSFIILAIAEIIFAQYFGLSLVILTYIIFSISSNLLNKNK